MTEVKCKVRSCHYWGNGDVCQADSIVVDNQVRKGTTRMEIGDLGDTDITKRPEYDVGNTGTERNLASTSEETLCRTFKPRGTQTK